MLLQSMVHESDTISFEFVIVWNPLRLIFEPLNLIPPDTIHTSSSHTVISACTEEPYASHDLILIVRGSDWNVVCKLMSYTSAIMLIRVIFSDTPIMLKC